MHYQQFDRERDCLAECTNDSSAVSVSSCMMRLFVSERVDPRIYEQQFVREGKLPSRMH